MQKMTNGKNKGFTLIEVSLAVMIIAILATFLANIMPTSFSVSQKTQDIIKASGLAQKYIENVKSEFAYTVNYDAAVDGATPPIALDTSYSDDGYYTVSTTVTTIETQVINAVDTAVLKEIDVEYIKTSTNQSLIKISTMIARPR